MTTNYAQAETSPTTPSHHSKSPSSLRVVLAPEDSQKTGDATPEQIPTIIRKCEILEVAYTAAREEGVAHGRAVKMCLKMHAVFRGSRMYVPARDPDVKSRRDEKLLREWRRGEQVKYLATRYGISERWVREIINGSGSDKP